jgi:hypothetical protein
MRMAERLRPRQFTGVSRAVCAVPRAPSRRSAVVRGLGTEGWDQARTRHFRVRMTARFIADQAVSGLCGLCGVDL